MVNISSIYMITIVQLWRSNDTGKKEFFQSQCPLGR